MTAPRLSLRSLERIAGPHAGPEVDPRSLRIGHVHLGIGAFHRAHQAVYTELAAASAGESGWGIAGVTQRSPDVRDQLAPQDGLYCVLERGDAARPPRIMGSVREVLVAPEDPEAIVTRIADPEVHVLTLTVTEKGYRRRRDGQLDTDDQAVAADLAGAGPITPVGQLVRGLQRRHSTSGAPLTVLCCDNLTSNGRVVAGLVDDFLAAQTGTDRVRDWLNGAVRFPSTMVDRIVPATTVADRAEITRSLGIEDRGLVVAEPFSQWVIEDDFAGPRPPWERAGAILTDTVAPWEKTKLRMLNASHSMLAYLGALRGYETIAEAVADEDLTHSAWRLMTDDAIPTLTAPRGLDLDAYGQEVLRRFANPAIRYTCEQVAMDGSQKLPVRLLGTVRDRLAAGAEPTWTSLAVAGWMGYVWIARAPDGRPLTIADPLESRLRAAVTGCDSPAAAVDALLGFGEVFSDDLPGDHVFRSLLISHLEGIVGSSA